MRRVQKWMAVYGLAAYLAAGVAVAQTDSVTIDDQPTTEQRLARVNDLRRAGRYPDAADLLQELVDEARFKLVTVDEGLYVDAELWAQGELLRDPTLLNAYRARYRVAADRALATARQDGSLAALREAYRRYGMTPAGLEAGLQLTGRLIERGDFDVAEKLLVGLGLHPDAAEAGGRLSYLVGVCAALRGDAEGVESSLDDLSATHGPLSDRLSALAASVDRPIAQAGGGLVEAGPVPEGLERSLWETPITDPQGREPSVFDGLRTLPVATGEMVLINAGRQLFALDRASGQPLWTYPTQALAGGGGGAEGPGAGRPRMERGPSGWLDTRGVAVVGDRVFAVLGDCRGIRGRGGGEFVLANLMVCVDRRTGGVLWSRQSGEVGEDEPAQPDELRGGSGVFFQTHFVGTPVTAQGQVFVIVRRTNITGVQTTWLASFEAGTGRLRWYRHIALVQARQGSDATRITPQLMIDGDTLYLTDQIAVAASLNVHSGAYNWLRVLAENRGQRFSRLRLTTDGVNTPPVMTSDGLVVALALSDQRLFLLDPADGRTLREMQDDQRLAGAQYILDAGGRVLVVSREYVALWDGQVVWAHRFEDGTVPRGRGAVTRQFVVIPTQQGITTLRLSDGVVLSETEVLAGNLAALDVEVLVSANGYVRSYMSWDHAYARLLDQVHAWPEDPGPGLSMAALAFERSGNGQEVLEGVGFALDAIGRLRGQEEETQRQRVLEGLRRMTAETGSSGEDLRAKLFDQMAQAVETAEQYAAYHLDRGRFLAQAGDPEQAVRHFQSVMTDPALTGSGYTRPHGGATSPAGAAAQHQLLELVRTHGRSVYRRYDALADQELELILASGEVDPDALARIARRYPLALSASRALLIAGEWLETAGHSVGALSRYQQAYYSAISPDQRAATTGTLLSYYERRGRTEDAVLLLERLMREDAALEPYQQGAPLSLSAWRGRFEAMGPQVGKAPRLAGRLGTPLLLEGELLLPPEGGDAAVLSGRLLVRLASGEVVRLDPAAGGAPVWAAPVPGEVLHVLAVDQGQVLVWSVDAQLLMALDEQTGAPLWQSPADLSEVLAQPAADAAPGNPRDLQHPENSQHLRQTAGVRMHVGPAVVCVIGPSGRVCGIDRYQGTRRWVVDTGLDAVTAYAADPWTLVVGGMAGPELDLSRGTLVLLDVYSGNPVFERVGLHVGFQPAAVGIRHGRLVAVAQAQSEVVVLDARTGESQWRRTLSDGDATGNSRLMGDVLAVEEAKGLTTVFGLEQEIQVRGRYRLAWGGDRRGLAMQATGGGYLLHGPLGVLAVDRHGRLLWRGTASPSLGRVQDVLAGFDYVAIIRPQDPVAGFNNSPPPGQSRRYRIDLVAAKTGLLEQTYSVGMRGQPFHPMRGTVAEGGVALAADGQHILLLPAMELPETVPAQLPGQ